MFIGNVKRNKFAQGPMDRNISRFEIIPIHLPQFAPVGDWYFETITYTFVKGKEIFIGNIKNFFELRYIYD